MGVSTFQAERSAGVNAVKKGTSDGQSYNSFTTPYASKPIQATLTTIAVARPANGHVRRHKFSAARGTSFLSAMFNAPSLIVERKVR
jgi:hypothetical protein